jgi:hypothetical protein
LASIFLLVEKITVRLWHSKSTQLIKTNELFPKAPFSEDREREAWVVYTATESRDEHYALSAKDAF